MHKSESCRFKTSKLLQNGVESIRKKLFKSQYKLSSPQCIETDNNKYITDLEKFYFQRKPHYLE